MKGKSFALNLIKEEQAAVHKEENCIVLWHKRLGHFHHDALLYMKKNNLVEGLPDLEDELPVCAACQYGKQTRLPFPKTMFGEHHTSCNWCIQMWEDLRKHHH
ncbi:hypothetical protein AB3S75_017762 [Citrus x aurantiifolia]